MESYGAKENVMTITSVDCCLKTVITCRPYCYNMLKLLTFSSHFFVCCVMIFFTLFYVGA